jgi:hypothetical protein
MGTMGAAAPMVPMVPMVIVKWVGIVSIGLAATAGAVHVARNAGAPPMRSPLASAALPAVVASKVQPSTASIPGPAAPDRVAPDPVVPDLRVANPVPQTPAATERRVVRAVAAPKSAPSLSREADEPIAMPTSALPTNPTSAPLPPTATPQVSQVPASTLKGETAMLDEARVAVRAGQAARALRALDAYNAAFPNGMLSPEATVLRIEVFESMGDRSGARRLADAFLAQHPDSPVAPRVRAIVGGPSNL